MKKFLKYIVLLVLIVLASLVTFDLLYSYVFKSCPPRNKLQYVMHLENKNLDYVFLGSSRVENTINTKLIEQQTGKKVLNIGIQGGRLNDNELMIRLLIANNVKVKTFFVQVDYVYNFDHTSTIAGTDCLPYIHNNNTIKNFRTDNLEYKLNYYIPFYRFLKNDFKIGFREFFSCLVHKTNGFDFSDGFDPKNEQFNNLGGSLPEEIADSNAAISNIDFLCKQNKIKIVYFCAPFCSKMENLDFIAKLKIKIPNLIDFSRTIKEDIYFKDCVHLNSQGADLFTKQLINLCFKGKTPPSNQ
jgi:hypothetical protein